MSMESDGLIENANDMISKVSLVGSDRSILVPASSFGTLRKDLIKNIGIEQAKVFLSRYGWDLGQKDAMHMLKKDFSSLKEIINYGPILHTEKGHVKAKVTRLDIIEEGENRSIHMEGIWEQSYEVAEHIKQFGVAREPICYTLIGYASGYVSKIFNETVIFKEVKCEGKGDDYCYWVGKSNELWEEDEVTESLKYFEQTHIEKELETTYEKLLEERNNLKRSSTIHKVLTEKLLVGSDLASIAKTIYQMTKIPGMVIDQTYTPLAYCGFTEQEVNEFSDSLHYYIKTKQIDEWRDTTHITLGKSDILLAPIFLKQNVIGYCMFIYDCYSDINIEVDQLILEQVALISSLSLLIEKAKFDAEHRIEGHFLEEILRGKYEEAEEILKRGLFMQIDLSQPYRFITVKYELQESDIKKELSYHEDLMETTTNYFRGRKEHPLIGHRDNSMLFLVSKMDLSEKEIERCFTKFLQFISKMFTTTTFVAGVSKRSTSITEAKEKYEESLIALRMATSNEQMVFFDSIGVIGPLLNENNAEEVVKISRNLLAPLLDERDLLKTLYTYLLHGGNLEKTANDIALSLSGLRYRLRKIEELLKQDIKDPFQNYQLLLAIQSLLLLGIVKI